MVDKIKISKSALEELEKLMGFKHTEAPKIISLALKLIDSKVENKNDKVD